jgi:hypothetical protein
MDLWTMLGWISAGRCARVSYLTHDGKRDPQADIDMGMKKLAPVGHMAPLEHSAKQMSKEEYDSFKQAFWVWDKEADKFTWDGKTYRHFLGNVQGFVQLRKMIPNEHDFGLLIQQPS